MRPFIRPSFLTFAFVLAALLALTPSARADVYALGESDILQDGIDALFSPSLWTGESHGDAFFVDGAQLETLDETARSELARGLRAGLPVVLLDCDQEDVAWLSSQLDRPPILDLGGGSLAVFALRGGGNPGSFAIDTTYMREPTRDEQEGVLEVLRDWFADPNESALATESTASTIDLTTQASAFKHKQLWPYQFYYTTHDTYHGNWQTCTNNYTIDVNVWPVFLQRNQQGGLADMDYFVVEVGGQWDASACSGFYPPDESYSDRMAGYYHDEILFSAAVDGFTNDFDALSVVSDQSSPGSTEPNVSNTTGLDWSLGGSGTVGVSAEGPEGSLSFSGGVTFKDETTVSYPATRVNSTVGSSAANGSGGPGGVGVAAWGFDFTAPGWPGNTCCGGGDMGTTPNTTGGSYQTTMTWIWEADSSVRSRYEGSGLPVKLYFSPTVASRYLGKDPYDHKKVDYATWGWEPRPDCYCYKQQETFPYVPSPATPTNFNVPFAPAD